MKILDTTQIKNWPDDVKLAVSESKENLSPELLSEAEKQEFKSFKHQKRKREYLLARYLLRLLVENEGINPDEVELLKEAKGKPYAKYGEEIIHVTFTHSDEMVMCAISRKRNIGLDVEHVSRKVSKMLVKRMLNEDEWKDIGTDNPLKIWTIKEAALKCMGTGLQSNLKDLTINKRERDWYLIRFNNEINIEICSFKKSDYQIALAYQSNLF